MMTQSFTPALSGQYVGRRVEILKVEGPATSGRYFKPGQFGYVVGQNTSGGMSFIDVRRESKPGEVALLISKTRDMRGGALWFSLDGVRFTGKSGGAHEPQEQVASSQRRHSPPNTFEVISNGRVIGHISAALIEQAEMDLIRGKRGGWYPPDATLRGQGWKAGKRGTHKLGERKQSMSYGEIPPYEEFLHDIHTRIDPETDEPYWPESMSKYPMELVSSREIDLAQDFGGLDSFSGRYAHKAGFRGDEKQIYDFLVFLMDQEDAYDGEEDNPGSLASSIMYTLGYEWV